MFMQHCFPFCFFRFLSVIKLFSVLTDDAAARANPPPPSKNAEWPSQTFRPLSSFCSLLSNQLGPWTQPRSMDPDHMANRAPNRLCHLSLLNQKQTQGLARCFEETRIKREAFPPSSTVYLACLHSLSLIYSYVLSLFHASPTSFFLQFCNVSLVAGNLLNLQSEFNCLKMPYSWLP